MCMYDGMYVEKDNCGVQKLVIQLLYVQSCRLWYGVTTSSDPVPVVSRHFY